MNLKSWVTCKQISIWCSVSFVKVEELLTNWQTFSRSIHKLQSSLWDPGRFVLAVLCTAANWDKTIQRVELVVPVRTLFPGSWVGRSRGGLKDLPCKLFCVQYSSLNRLNVFKWFLDFNTRMYQCNCYKYHFKFSIVPALIQTAVILYYYSILLVINSYVSLIHNELVNLKMIAWKCCRWAYYFTIHWFFISMCKSSEPAKCYL